MSTVDIVIPAYNAAATISRTMDSVIAQTFRDWNLWVVDDGSADGTADCVRRYLGDPRVKLLRQENRGCEHARNRGTEEIRTDYATFLDADDFWEPGFLSRMVPALRDDPGAGLAWCDLATFGDASTSTYRGERAPIAGGPEETLDAIYRGVTFLPSCTLFRSRFFREGLRWTQEFWPMADMLVFFSIAARSRVVHVGEVLANYRVHPGSATSSSGAIARNRPAMVRAFTHLYREYRDRIPRRSYLWRMWYIHHYAGDTLVREGRRAWPLLLRAILHRPAAAVSWKVLIQALLRA